MSGRGSGCCNRREFFGRMYTTEAGAKGRLLSGEDGGANRPLENLEGL